MAQITNISDKDPIERITISLLKSTLLKSSKNLTDNNKILTVLINHNVK
jgi:hypothetical protein